MPVSIVICEDSRTVRAAIQALLTASGVFHVSAAVTNGIEAVATCRQIRPQMILLDVTMPVLDGVEAARQITLVSPETVIVMLSSVDDLGVVRRALTAGAHDYVFKPVTGPELIQRLLVSFQRDRPRRMPQVGEGGRERLLVMTSAKAGAGVTTLAVNAACALARRTRGRILLVDLDLQFADATHCMGLTSEVVAPELVNLDDAARQAAMNKVVLSTPYGVRVMVGPPAPYRGPIDDVGLFSLIQKAGADSDFVLVDLPHGHVGLWTRLVDLSDQVLFVIPSDVPSVRSAKVCIQALERYRHIPKCLKFVYNQNSPDGTVELQDVEILLGHKVFAAIHYDREATTKAYVAQVPLVVKGGATIIGDIEALVDRMVAGQGGTGAEG